MHCIVRTFPQSVPALFSIYLFCTGKYFLLCLVCCPNSAVFVFLLRLHLSYLIPVTLPTTRVVPSTRFTCYTLSYLHSFIIVTFIM
ncbi:hypothetical protein V8C37DRAFT_203724 [Trichoderma ceciliae]